MKEESVLNHELRHAEVRLLLDKLERGERLSVSEQRIVTRYAEDSENDLKALQGEGEAKDA